MKKRMQPRWYHLSLSTIIVQQHLNHYYVTMRINNSYSIQDSKVNIKAYYHNLHQTADLQLIYFNHNYLSLMMIYLMTLVIVISGTGRLIMLLLHPHPSLDYRIQQEQMTKDPHFVLKYTQSMENRMKNVTVLALTHHSMQPISMLWKRMQYKLGIAKDPLMQSIKKWFLNKGSCLQQCLYWLRRIPSCFPPPLLFTNMAQPLKRQLTLALLKPDICADASLPPRILDAIKANKMKVLKQRQVLWTQEQAGAFYAEHKGKFFYERLCGYMTR